MLQQMARCKGCLEKGIKIDDLRAELERQRKENARLRKKLGKKHRTIDERRFGSSTPSSQLPPKGNSSETDRGKRGGAKPGHIGKGRQRLTKTADVCVEQVEGPAYCLDCGMLLEHVESRCRDVIDCEPLRIVSRIYRFERKRCPDCGRYIQPFIPGVLPKFRFGNALLSELAVGHYLFGHTLGHLTQRTGVKTSSLINAMHSLASRLKAIPDRLAEELRQAPCKHADETTWRNDGANGYGWLFATPQHSIFCFRNTRSSKVPLEILGDGDIPGVLVTDRYAGYKPLAVKRQYCYAHLLRDLQDLEKDFPDETEVAAFVQALAPLIALAMKLRGREIDDTGYYRQAKKLKRRIVRMINRQAKHAAVQSYQSIFRENRQCMYHWAKDRRVPADNNFAERELRPTVIARKISYGSQSEQGARTREILMTVLHSLRKQTKDPADAMRRALDQIALQPNDDIYRILFPKSPQPH